MTGTYHNLPPCDPDQCVFYITSQRDRQVARAAGPYADAAAAVADVPRVVRECELLDPWCAFDAWSVCRLDHHGKPTKQGRLNVFAADVAGFRRRSEPNGRAT